MSARRIVAVLGAVALLATAACQETRQPPVASADPVADSADQVLFGVKHQLTDAGVRQAQLVSDTAFVFDDGQRILLRKVHLTFFTEQGVQNAVLVSKKGTYDTRNQSMQADGDVVVTTTDGRRLETQQLKFDQVRNEISSDSAYVATETGRRQSGIGFRSDPNMRNVQCLRACAGMLGAVNLPTAAATPAGPTPPAAAGVPAAARADSGRRGLRPGNRPGSFRLP